MAYNLDQFGGKAYLRPDQRPRASDIGVHDLSRTGAPGPVFHRHPNTPSAAQLMNTPIDKGEGNNRMNNPYLTVEDLPRNWAELMADEARKGRGLTSFMRALGLTRAGFETILATCPEFQECYERCLILSAEWWEDRGRDMACGEKGSAPVWIANMVNRWGWNSTRSEQLGQANSMSVDVKVDSSKRELTEEELNAELEKRGISLDLTQPPAGY